MIKYGLRLRARILAGETLNLNQEQATLRGLLLEGSEARRVPDFGGEPGSGKEHFLGARYALACWLDELFIEYSPWSKPWSEQLLEKALYGSEGNAERGAFFWEQATRAETQPREDALEAFFLCVMLGYRGSRRDKHDELQAWCDTVSKRVARAQGSEWSPPEELEPPINVPPLRGRERLKGMYVAAAIFVFGVVPPFAYLFVTRFLR